MDLPHTPRTRDPRALAKAQASDADELAPVAVDVPRPGEEAQSRVRKVRGGAGHPGVTSAPHKPRA
jgi:hypothetical protein